MPYLFIKPILVDMLDILAIGIFLDEFKYPRIIPTDWET
jgi:hypothetical protein